MGVRVEKVQFGMDSPKWLVTFMGVHYWYDTFEEAVKKADECRERFMEKKMEAVV